MIRINKTISYNNGTDGFKFQDATDALVLQSEFELNGGNGIDLLNGAGSRIVGSDMARNTLVGLLATGTNGGLSSNELIISSTQFGNNVVGDIKIDGWNGTTYSSINNTITGCHFFSGGSTTDAANPSVILLDTFGNSLSGNTFNSASANRYTYAISELNTAGHAAPSAITATGLNGTFSVGNFNMLAGTSSRCVNTDGICNVTSAGVKTTFLIGGDIGTSNVAQFGFNTGAAVSGVTGTLWGWGQSGVAWIGSVNTTGTLGVLGNLNFGGTNYGQIQAANTAPRTYTFPDAAGNVVLDTATQTLTNKSIDSAQLTGTVNIARLPAFARTIELVAAGCSGTTALTAMDLPAANAAAPACVSGTNVNKGVMAYVSTAATTNIAMWPGMKMPAGTTGTLDFNVLWSSAGITGNFKGFVGVGCAAANATATDDPAFTDSTFTTAAAGTTNQVTTSTITGVTGCTAGQILHVRFKRNTSDAADTLGTTVNLIGAEIVVRVTPQS